MNFIVNAAFVELPKNTHQEAAMEVSLLEMLEAREQRAQHQQALLSKYAHTLLCFTMNIAGPVKNSPTIQQGFTLGLKRLEDQFRVVGIRILHWEQWNKHTGNEAFFVLDRNPLAVKAVTTQIEDQTTAGRLFDMDVLCADGRKVDRQELGLPGRKCLICGQPAQVCARSRTHTVAQLQERTLQILSAAIQEEAIETIARLACQSLLYEAATTPKPGLVDRANSGSHKDMDIFTFQASAAALWPYFARCAEIGRNTRQDAPEETFAQLRTPGKTAEGNMLRATKGVNTHKGAIFSMGVLCGALGRLEREQWANPERVLSECAAMTSGLVSHDYANLTPETAITTGQKLYLQYGIAGVRSEAEAGFPTVLNIGLPKLETGLALGKTMDESGCAALIAMLAQTVDTNMIHRGGYALAKEISQKLGILLETEPFPSKQTLEQLDAQFIRKNLSPGGTADLLALVYMLHFLKEESDECVFHLPNLSLG